MEMAAVMAERFLRDFEDDPFCYNETASVSLLCSAAAGADMLALAEYCVWKKSSEDGRKSVRGRCDLWIGNEESTWAIEFKQVI
ncbi:MAG: hypothetical protein ACTHOL_17910, partial [Luteibacter jiangsuensis]